MSYSASFFVVGVPRPKGNAKIFGGRLVLGDAKAKRWEREVAKVAASHAPDDLLDGPCNVSLRFCMERPKKTKYPLAPCGTPDLDKLCRCALDALTGVILRDDARVVRLSAWKEWASYSGVDVLVYEIDSDEGEGALAEPDRGEVA